MGSSSISPEICKLARPGLCSLLSGEHMTYPHRFSGVQMRSLVDVVDTFVPSISYETFSTSETSKQQLNSEAWSKHNEYEIQAFYELSASQAGVPAYAAGLMHSKLKPDVLKVISWILWLLSSRLGTYLMCGRGSLCWKFPYFRRFGEIPVPDREKLLINAWSRSPYVFFRGMFDAFKIFSVYSHFTKVDEKGRNPTWDAIGYCGPDPAAVDYRKKAKEGEARRPLEGRVLDAEELGERLPEMLEAAGFEVTEEVSELAALWEEGSSSSRSSKSKSKAIAVKCDAVVVGSGSGGGVAAGVLARAGFKVLVVEKGRYVARDDLTLLEGPTLDKMYEGGGILATENGGVLILAGATVGGGSAVNWSASFRTPAHILEEWADDHGLGLFKSFRYKEAMDAVCGRLGVQPAVAGGENLQNGVLRRGCEALGYDISAVPRNCRPDHRCGWCCFGCWNGQKQATSETWLTDAGAGGAVILASCLTLSVLLRSSSGAKPRQAVGVVAAAGSVTLYISARATVISAGSLHSPRLLHRSGLLNPAIGRHLHLHPVQMLWGYFPDAPSTSYEGAIITSFSTQTANWHPRGHGCILQCPSAHPGVFSVLTPWLSGPDFKSRLRRFSRTVHIFALARDRGSGAVRLSDPAQYAPSIDYVLHPDDHARLLDGGEAALRVLVAAGAVEVGTHHRHGDRLVISPSTSADEVEAFLDRVRQRGIDQLGAPMCSAHQMGSCRMGNSPADSVVDPDGETWEAAGGKPPACLSLMRVSFPALWASTRWSLFNL